MRFGVEGVPGQGFSKALFYLLPLPLLHTTNCQFFGADLARGRIASEKKQNNTGAAHLYQNEYSTLYYDHITISTGYKLSRDGALDGAVEASGEISNQLYRDLSLPTD